MPNVINAQRHQHFTVRLGSKSPSDAGRNGIPRSRIIRPGRVGAYRQCYVSGLFHHGLPRFPSCLSWHGVGGYPGTLDVGDCFLRSSQFHRHPGSDAADCSAGDKTGESRGDHQRSRCRRASRHAGSVGTAGRAANKIRRDKPTTSPAAAPYRGGRPPALFVSACPAATLCGQSGVSARAIAREPSLGLRGRFHVNTELGAVTRKLRPSGYMSAALAAAVKLVFTALVVASRHHRSQPG